MANLRHVLYVGEDRVFQAVTGVRPTAAFSRAQVFREPESKEKTWVTSWDKIGWGITRYEGELLICFTVRWDIYLLFRLNKSGADFESNEKIPIAEILQRSAALLQHVWLHKLRLLKICFLINQSTTNELWYICYKLYKILQPVIKSFLVYFSPDLLRDF